MIKDPIVAERLIALFMTTMSDLDASVAMVKTHCDEAEFLAYRKAVATVLAELIAEVGNPLFQAHPNLAPPQLAEEP